MKAIVNTTYGSPDILTYTDVDKPTPTDDEVLVKVVMASANPLDWHIMRAQPFIARIDSGLLRPKNTILGADIAGTIEAVGKNVTQFKVGDAVFGDTSSGGLGGFAEYVTVPPKALALIPDGVTFEAAAATPVTGFTALQGLRDTGKISAGQNVLVNGASGGVGSIAVQIAKSYDTEVTGVCSGRNVEMVRSIGADHVIDYTQEDFTRNGQQYDLIFDAVGNRSIFDYARALSDNGICSIAGFTTMPRLFQHGALGWFATRGTQKTIGLMGTARSNPDDLLILQDMLATKKVVPVIDRCYDLRDTAEAIRYLETGRARGKVIIKVADATA